MRLSRQRTSGFSFPIHTLRGLSELRGPILMGGGRYPPSSSPSPDTARSCDHPGALTASIPATPAQRGGPGSVQVSWPLWDGRGCWGGDTG